MYNIETKEIEEETKREEAATREHDGFLITITTHATTRNRGEEKKKRREKRAGGGRPPWSTAGCRHIGRYLCVLYSANIVRKFKFPIIFSLQHTTGFPFTSSYDDDVFGSYYKRYFSFFHQPYIKMPNYNKSQKRILGVLLFRSSNTGSNIILLILIALVTFCYICTWIRKSSALLYPYLLTCCCYE